MHDFLKDAPKNNFIVLRHDIDLSLKHALMLAEAEGSLGVRSTYFTRVNKFVDPFSAKNSEILKKIAGLGHEIGLHYDSDIIKMNDFKGYLLDKKNRLEKSANTKVYGASLHKIKSVDGKNEISKLNFIEEFLSDIDMDYDAYSEKFIREMKYISDSARQWKEGCMCNHIGKETKLCILTHPIWWSQTTSSLVSIIETLL